MLNHAFILSAHTNFEQIKLLLSTLHFGDVFIHVDKKSEELYQKLKVEYSNAQNIYFEVLVPLLVLLQLLSLQ